MSLADWVLGRPLASDESEENKIRVWQGLPVLGLDALSSAAYGPEAALTILLPLGVLGLSAAMPIIALILFLLAILYFSYRQTIQAYPSGGGSYIVAKENLGTTSGLFAAAALMVDYILTVAVGISAGVGALISAFPALHPYTLGLCLLILAIVTIVNLRGLRESGFAFAIPTYAFIVSLLGVIGFGVYKVLTSKGAPVPLEAPPPPVMATMALTPWIFLRAFASGCTAMTGVEAVSNGIQAFAKPRVLYAQRTLTAIIATLALLLAGIGYLAHAYSIGATDPDSANYQSVISMIVAAVAGRGVIYYVTLLSVIAVLALSANTCFADFPRLCHLVAEDEFLPHFFAVRGRRLVYSSGIIVLSVVCAILLIVFGGITDRLIPLFAIGAFLAFTLSQAGMVAHWVKVRKGKWRASLAINLFGAICTAVTLVVVLVAKFRDGAWILVVLVPGLVGLFSSIKRHYATVSHRTSCFREIQLDAGQPPLVVLPFKGWSMVAERGLRFALDISPDVLAFHVLDEDDNEETHLKSNWDEYVVAPLRRAGRPVPELRLVHSPYRRFILPMIALVKELKEKSPGRVIAVVVPELVESKWYQIPLHNQRANLLKAALLLTGGDRRRCDQCSVVLRWKVVIGLSIIRKS